MMSIIVSSPSKTSEVKPAPMRNGGGYVHTGVVSRIGKEPMLEIDGLGEMRFAYRNVRRRANETKQELMIGDVMQVRLDAQAKKVAGVRLVRRGSAREAGKKDGRKSVAEKRSPMMMSLRATTSFYSTGSEADSDDKMKLSSQSPSMAMMPSPWNALSYHAFPPQAPSAMSSWDERQAATPSAYSHDPYSLDGPRYNLAGSQGAPSSLGHFPSVELETSVTPETVALLNQEEALTRSQTQPHEVTQDFDDDMNEMLLEYSHSYGM